MAYRSGTYIAFHANGTDVPIDSDIKYYNLLKAWTAKTDDDFSIVNSHDKASSVRDSSKKATLRSSLLERLRNSRNLVLIIGGTTWSDTDWVPFEIANAIDRYKLPIIATYPEYPYILTPHTHRSEWPHALETRIDSGEARVIHIPFKKAPLAAAIDQFDCASLPSSGLSFYTRESYVRWGLIA